MSNVVSAVNERNFVAQTIGVNPATLSPSQLRSEMLLAASQTYSYKFTQTGKPAASVVVTDQLLAQSDRFLVTGISFALKQIGAATPTDAQQTVAILYQFNNTKVFTQSNDANMQAIYNGFAKITLDERVIYPKVLMRNFERVSTTQQGNVLAAITGPTTYTAGRDELPYSSFGEMPVTPFMLGGDSKFTIDLNLPAPVTINTTNYSNYGVFLLRGYLAAATI